MGSDAKRTARGKPVLEKPTQRPYFPCYRKYKVRVTWKDIFTLSIHPWVLRYQVGKSAIGQIWVSLTLVSTNQVRSFHLLKDGQG